MAYFDLSEEGMLNKMELFPPPQHVFDAVFSSVMNFSVPKLTRVSG